MDRNHSVLPAAEADASLMQALDGYLAAVESGTAPPEEQFLARYPHLAGDLRECLASLAFIRRASPGVPSLADAPQQGAESESGCLGDFRIVREVGRGGMGVVYEAEQISLGRRVALKVLPFAATMDPRQLQRFHNEARSVACLHHEHIVPIHAVGCERGVHFYAMQFIDGRTLAELIGQLQSGDEPTTAFQARSPDADTAAIAAARTGQAPRDAAYCRRVAEWGIQAAEALEHAHSLGIVHRDIKPGNLMIDAQGKLWVTDFGLARTAADVGLTMTGDMLGTLRYMSPEQALAKHGLVDHRSDVYALGVTLYEVLTGRPAIEGADSQEILSNIALKEPKPPRALNRSIPRDLETVLLKAIAKEPGTRYATAGEMAEDLGRFLRSEPVRGRRPTLFQRTRAWTRRRRALVWSAAVCLIVAVAAAGGSIGWLAGENATRLKETEKVILAALTESERWQEQRKMPQSLLEARRANGMLAGGPVSDAFRSRVEGRLADLELVARLEEIRLDASAVKNDTFDFESAEREYNRAFREYGLDIENLRPHEAAELIRKTTVPTELAEALTELAAGLDRWAGEREAGKRNALQGQAGANVKRLLEIASGADPDEVRNQLRSWLRQKDPATLKPLASVPVKDLSPSTVLLLARAVQLSGENERGIALLKEARLRTPGDFWITHELAYFLKSTPRTEETVRFETVAAALRPECSRVHTSLGLVLLRMSYRQSDSRKQELLDDAFVHLREAIQINPDYASGHYHLGIALRGNGQLDDAIAALREVIRLKPDFKDAPVILSDTLRVKKSQDDAMVKGLKNNRRKPPEQSIYASLSNAVKSLLDGAIADAREATRLEPDSAFAHVSLDIALSRKGLMSPACDAYREAIRLEPDFAIAHRCLGIAMSQGGAKTRAIAALREAIRLRPHDAIAHSSLGFVLAEKGSVDALIGDKDGLISSNGDEAIAECREAIRLKPGYPDAHFHLGTALRYKYLVNDSIPEFREAIRLKPDFALAHCYLGLALEQTGQFADALRSFRHGHELGSRNPGWHQPSASWIEDCEQNLRLDARLPAILAGKEKPATPNELLECTYCLECKQLPGAAARLFQQAFAADPLLVSNVQLCMRYNAARAAARAGCGQGKDAAQFTEAQRARWRQQALEWLQAEIPVLVAMNAPWMLRRWQQDPVMAGVREPKALAGLPPHERDEWCRLWAQVAEGSRDLVGHPKPKKQPRPTP